MEEEIKEMPTISDDLSYALGLMLFIERLGKNYREVIAEAIAYTYYNSSVHSPEEFIDALSGDLVDLMLATKREDLSHLGEFALKNTQTDHSSIDNIEDFSLTVFMSVAVQFEHPYSVLKVLLIAYLLCNAMKDKYLDTKEFAWHVATAIHSSKVKATWSEMFKSNSVN